MNDTQELCNQWIYYKELEKDAQEKRRKLEDQLLTCLHLPEVFDGTQTKELDVYKVKLVGRMNRTIDADRLQEIAAENGLSDHLSSLFRWKPEINAALWKAADKSITEPLLGAITTKPGRPSFSIEINQE